MFGGIAESLVTGDGGLISPLFESEGSCVLGDSVAEDAGTRRA
jgi:hypothetical protein